MIPFLVSLPYSGNHNPALSHGYAYASNDSDIMNLSVIVSWAVLSLSLEAASRHKPWKDISTRFKGERSLECDLADCLSEILGSRIWRNLEIVAAVCDLEEASSNQSVSSKSTSQCEKITFGPFCIFKFVPKPGSLGLTRLLTLLHRQTCVQVMLLPLAFICLLLTADSVF